MSASEITAPKEPAEHSTPIVTCGKYRLDLSKRTHVMGIVNVTPDSFSDGGKFLNHRHALDHAKRMLDEGADIIDVGGESTRPGAQPTSLEEERRRVMPVIKKLALHGGVPLSIDTTKVAVAREAVEAGAVIINDISSFNFEPEMVHLAAAHKVAVVLMHMKGKPQTMQHQVVSDFSMSEIYSFLKERIDYAESAGIDSQQIIIDPGIGFGKSVPEGNLRIIKNLATLRQLGKPILVGLSRKAFIGHVLELGVEEREEGTAAALALAINNGAHIVRVHDVKKMKRVVKMVDAILAMN
jgi:dihydropteroate synthase